MAQFSKDVLVDTEWVEQNIDDPGVRLIEVDEDTEAYQRSHIRNAVGVHWRNDLQDYLRRDFIDAASFGALMDKIGVTNDTLVILYGGNNNWFAAYAYWYFRVYGHGSVKLMDGGRKKWELEGRELTLDPPKVVEGAGYQAKPADASIRALRGYVEETVLNNPAFGLVDVRSPEEYRGDLLAPAHLPQEQAQKPGHIPGAANIPWSRAVSADSGAFLSADELTKLYANEGITPEREIVAYCRIGERSAHTWFVLHELLGYPKVRNYDGSWTEWGSLVNVPIER